MQNVSVVSCVSDFEKYDRFVRGSFKTGRQSGAVELLAIDNTSNRYSAPAALNKGLEKAVGDIIVFCHQDVVFPEKWIESLAGQIAIIEDMCENWGGLDRRAGGYFAGCVFVQRAVAKIRESEDL